MALVVLKIAVEAAEVEPASGIDVAAADGAEVGVAAGIATEAANRAKLGKADNWAEPSNRGGDSPCLAGHCLAKPALMSELWLYA